MAMVKLETVSCMIYSMFQRVYSEWAEIKRKDEWFSGKWESRCVLVFKAVAAISLTQLS